MKKLKIIALSFFSLFLINCVCYAKELDKIYSPKIEENVELNSSFNEEIYNKQNKKLLSKKTLKREESSSEKLKKLFSKKKQNKSFVNQSEENKAKNLKYKDIEKFVIGLLEKHLKNYPLNEPAAENKRYAIIKTNGFEKFKYAVNIIKNINDSNLLEIKNKIKQLNKIFSDFIYFYECSNKEELLSLMKMQKIKQKHVETVLNFNDSYKIIEYYEDFKNEIKKIKNMLKNKKTNVEEEEENKYIEDYLIELKAKFYKFAKELNVLMQDAKKSNFLFI